jgi:tetratricopeptide (TPR) repeat protein
VVAERREQRPVQAGGPRPPRMVRPKLRKPNLPEGQRPFIDKDALRDLRGAARKDDLDDVIKAFSLAGEAIEEDRLDDAIELLEWAKAQVARSAVVREALGIALYLKGDFAKAHSELLTYRRLSNRHDQNHVLADCARAAGRHDKVAEYVEEMLAAKAPRDRTVEGLIVLAGDRADRGDLRGALDTLNRADLAPANVEPYHARLWYAAADICARLGDLDAEREYLEAIAAVDDDFLDVAERLGSGT